MAGFREKSPDEITSMCSISRTIGLVRYRVNKRDRLKPMIMQDRKTSPMVAWVAFGLKAILSRGSTSQRIRPLTDSRSQVRMQSRSDSRTRRLPVSSGWALKTPSRSARENSSVFMLLTGEQSLVKIRMDLSWDKSFRVS